MQKGKFPPLRGTGGRRIVSINGLTTSLPLEIPPATHHTFGHGSRLRDDEGHAPRNLKPPHALPPLRHSAATAQNIWRGACFKESQTTARAPPTPSFRSHRAKCMARSMLQGISNHRSRSPYSVIPQPPRKVYGAEHASRNLKPPHALPPLRHSAATAQSIWRGACFKESQTAALDGVPLKETKSTMLSAIESSPSMTELRLCH